MDGCMDDGVVGLGMYVYWHLGMSFCEAKVMEVMH